MPTTRKVNQMQAHEVAAWLGRLSLIDLVKPVEVTIGKQTYQGVYYHQTRKLDPSMPAYRDGQREYVVVGYYLLGELPASFRHRHARVYLANGYVYYIAAYYQGEPNDSHPFGKMFVLLLDEQRVIEPGTKTMQITITELANQLELS